MNPLYRNDRPGEHAPSWYAASVPNAALRPPLRGVARADVAILGAGYTGLWAALTLARAGRRVVVLDAHRVGFGASGRNGGQLQAGFNIAQQTLEARLGETRARALWDLADAGRAEVKAFCEAEAPEAQFTAGMAHGEYSRADLRAARAHAADMRDRYGYATDVLEPDAFRALVRSPLYHGGTFDPQGGHLQPLAYAQALARVAEAEGVTIHERTEVTQVIEGPKIRFVTPEGAVEADHAILAGNGYMPPLVPQVAARVMPINSFIAATEPLPDRWQEVLTQNIAVSDSKFVVNYYRFSPERRFLFGGRESYSIGFPQDIQTALIARMIRLFPQLKGVAIDHVWGGTLGITMTRVPHIARLGPNLLSGAGFSGHGVALSCVAGRVMAQAIVGQQDGLTTMEALPVPTFPGGRAFRAPLLTLAMTWYALRDRLGV